MAGGRDAEVGQRTLHRFQIAGTVADADQFPTAQPVGQRGEHGQILDQRDVEHALLVELHRQQPVVGQDNAVGIRHRDGASDASGSGGEAVGVLRESLPHDPGEDARRPGIECRQADAPGAERPAARQAEPCQGGGGGMPEPKSGPRRRIYFLGLQIGFRRLVHGWEGQKVGQSIKNHEEIVVVTGGEIGGHGAY